jgi:hypothetical protein
MPANHAEKSLIGPPWRSRASKEMEVQASVGHPFERGKEFD